MMKASFMLFPLLGWLTAWAQPVPRTVVVEHFTNTKCSVCASRNPSFYQTLSQQNDVLHIAYHPSSPYSACGFSKHNPVENDSRTNFYGVYGSTPRLVIQGNVVPANANYASAALYTPYAGVFSAFDISVKTQRSSDSLFVRIAIRQVDTFAAANSLALFAGIAEDTVQFSGGNGEKTHYDVFRKSVFGTTPLALSGLGQVGDSLVLTQSLPLHTAWNPTRLYAYALLQTPTKSIIQAGKSPVAQATQTSIPQPNTSELLRVFPNPTQGWLGILPAQAKPLTVSIYDMQGNLIHEERVEASRYLDLRSLANGQYYLRACNGICTESVSIQKQ